MTVSRAVFLGSKAFGLVILRSLLDTEPGVSWTVLHPHDAEDGRSVIGDFEALCAERGIEFRLVTASQANEALLKANAHVVFVCGWYRLIPLRVLEAGPVFLGIHNSLLPRYRGGAPLVWALIQGDETVGSSLFELGDGMDDGDIYLQVSAQIDQQAEVADALVAIEEQYLQHLPAFWKRFVAGKAQAKPQDHSKATYCAQRLEQDGAIDWSQSAARVCNFVRAQSRPYPGAFTVVDGKEVRVWRCEPDPRPWLGRPGQVVERRKDGVVVTCGEKSALIVREAQSRDSDEVASIFRSIDLRLTAQAR